jgi:hypothetical protein
MCLATLLVMADLTRHVLMDVDFWFLKSTENGKTTAFLSELIPQVLAPVFTLVMALVCTVSLVFWVGPSVQTLEKVRF